jgi:hypothetical protein
VEFEARASGLIRSYILELGLFKSYIIQLFSALDIFLVTNDTGLKELD